MLKHLKLKQYIILMRFDRPIGILLLLWPTLWGLWFAGHGHPPVKIVLIFIAGVVVARALGCVMNDISDRKFDSHVARTKNRPLASGKINLLEAWVVFIVLCFLGLALISLLNYLTIFLAIIALMLAMIYPLMKRIVHWPQFILGLVFGAWPILMAYAAVQNRLPGLCWLLAAAAFCWTVAYDTMYAIADKADDLTIGIKSTAIWFGAYTQMWIVVFQLVMLVLMLIAGIIVQLNFIYYIGLLVAIGLFSYEHYLIKTAQPKQCLTAFLHNKWVGLSIFLATAFAWL